MAREATLAKGTEVWERGGGSGAGGTRARIMALGRQTAGENASER
jgi:hypothetical protein